MAMSCGVVSVAVNACGCNELINPGGNGFLFKPRDVEELAVKLEQAIDSRLGSNARETITRGFNSKTNVKKISSGIPGAWTPFLTRKQSTDVMTIAGIDEAGRGCVIGPLVIAGALFEDEVVSTLPEIGVKDSKKLSAKKRVKLFDEIKELALDYAFFELSPTVIDKVVFRNVPLRRLNYLETMAMASVLRKLRPDEAHVDPCDVDSDRCARQIQSVIPFKIKIKCEPRADAKYPSTGAASILAKVTRDKRVKALRELYGDFNSGYPSDSKTQNFIRDYFENHSECPDFIRGSWSTVQRHMKKIRLMQ